MTFRTVYSSQLIDRGIRKIFLQNRYGKNVDSLNKAGGKFGGKF